MPATKAMKNRIYSMGIIPWEMKTLKWTLMFIWESTFHARFFLVLVANIKCANQHICWVKRERRKNLKRNINPQTQKHSGERLLRNIMPMIGRHAMKNFWQSLNLQIMCSTDRKEVQSMKVSLRKGRLGNGPM